MNGTVKKLIRLLTLLSVVFVFCSCAYKPIEPSENDITAVGTVNGREVCLDELRFAAYACRDALTSKYGDGIFEGEDAEKYLDMLREMVYSSITANYAVISLCEEASITLGETAVVEKVDETLGEMVEELGGMGKYKKYLAENHMTDRFLRFNTEVELLKNELKYVYIQDLSLIENDDEKLLDIISDEFILVRHIYVTSSEGARQSLENALERLENGEAFTSLMSELNEDTEMTESGLFILKGYMTEKYESVAFSLKVGEVSDVISDGNGYYLIKREAMPLTSVWLNFEHLKELYQTYTFYSMLDEKQATLSFVPYPACEEYMKSPFSE